MKCIECPHFEVAYEPMMPFDMGLAVCKKYNLETDFADRRKLNRLTFVGKEKKKVEERV